MQLREVRLVKLVEVVKLVKWVKTTSQAAGTAPDLVERREVSHHRQQQRPHLIVVDQPEKVSSNTD